MNRTIVIRRAVLLALWIGIMILAWRRWDIRHSASEDVDAPVITGIQELTSATMVEPGTSLSLAVTAEDASGIAQYSVTLRAASGEASIFSYPADQTQQLTQMIVAIPSDQPAGEYEISAISVTDLYQNSAYYEKQGGIWYLGGVQQAALSGTQSFAITSPVVAEVLPPSEPAQAQENMVDAPQTDTGEVPPPADTGALTEPIPSVDPATGEITEPIPSVDSGMQTEVPSIEEDPVYTDGENEYEIDENGEFVIKDDTTPSMESEPSVEVEPSAEPGATPSIEPSAMPSLAPSTTPSTTPSVAPSKATSTPAVTEKAGLLSITKPKAATSFRLPNNYTIQMSAKDSSGFQNVEVILSNQNPNGNSGRFSLSLNGIKSFDSATFCLQENALKAGIYHVSEIVLTNGSGDKKCYYRKEKVANGVRTYGSQWYLNAQPVKGMQASLKVTIIGTNSDTEGPKVKSLSGLTYTDSATEGENIKISLNATDSSGIANVMVSFRKAGAEVAERTAYAELSGAKTISSVTIGVYEGMFDDGIYVSDKIVLVDTYGNASIFTSNEGIWSCNTETINEKPVVLRFEYKKKQGTTSGPSSDSSAAVSVAVSAPSAGSTSSVTTGTGVGATLYFDENGATGGTTGTTVYGTASGNSSTRNSSRSTGNSNSSSSSSSSSGSSASEPSGGSEPSGTSAPSGSTAEATMIDEKTVKKAFKNLSENKEAVVDISTNACVPPKAFKLLQKAEDDETSLLLSANDYSWHFAKKDLTNVDAVSGFFNAEILTGADVAVTKLSEYLSKYQLEDMDHLNYQVKYTSQFPGKANISLKWSTDYAGMSAFIYKLDGEDAPLYAQTEVAEDGTVSFDLEKGESGFITVQQVELPETEEERQLRESIAESEKLSNNKMKQGILLVVGAMVFAVILCIVLIVSKKKRRKKGSKANKKSKKKDEKKEET